MSENTKPKKVILDVDTGSDDAVAIMTALQSDELDVVAICCVWGNLSVEDTTENTCRRYTCIHGCTYRNSEIS